MKINFESKSPPYLRKGDKVAIVSPAGAVDPKYIDGACDTLSSWGLIPVVGEFARGRRMRFSGTDDERLSDLQHALDDSSVKAILCSRGGYGVVRIVERINFDVFSRHPKWLIGFSDITILHAAALRVGVKSIHSVMARALTNYDSEREPVSMLHEILFGNPPIAYGLSPNELNRHGESKGVLVGGNLSVLYGLRGTGYDIRPEGKILFIEDLSEKLYHIDRMLRNFRLGGILSRLSGLLVGQFTEIEDTDSFSQNVEEVIASAVEGYSYPVAFGFPVGHVSRNLPVIHGARICMSVSKEKAEVCYLR